MQSLYPLFASWATNTRYMVLHNFTHDSWFVPKKLHFRGANAERGIGEFATVIDDTLWLGISANLFSGNRLEIVGIPVFCGQFLWKIIFQRRQCRTRHDQ